METKYQLASRLLTIAVVFIAVLLYSKFGFGIPINQNQVITNKADFFTVTGEGRVQTKPDTVETTIGFVGNGKTVIEAQTKTNAVMNRVTDAIKKLGVVEDDIKTVNYSVNPEYRSEPVSMDVETKPQFGGTSGSSQAVEIAPMPPLRDTNPKIIGYTVTSTIQVKIKDLQKVNSVIDAATQNGANQIYGVEFTVAEKDKFISEARGIAIEKAKKKAAEIARQTGITLGRIVNVYNNESSPYGGGMMYATKAVPDAANQTQIEPGSTEITVSVTLNYETK